MPSDTPFPSRPAVALVVIAATAMALAGCGGDPAGMATSTVARQAGGSGCIERPSIARSLQIRNLLPVEVWVKATDVNCKQWSGVSTPWQLDGTVIAAGMTVRQRLEMARSVSPSWTLVLRANRTGMPFGITCPRPRTACGYGLSNAPAGPDTDSVVVSTEAQPSWAATAAQVAALAHAPVDQITVWSDGSKVYVSARTVDDREITDSVT